MDLLLAFLFLVIFAPVAALVAGLVKLTSRGPVLYWQTRVGKDGETFRFPKFRTMVQGADQRKSELNHLAVNPGDVIFKLRNDPRVTPVGRFLRKTSLDELPQLMCVLGGEMSLVGPRPPLPEEVMNYRSHELLRLRAVPGLTCLWQVNGRSELPFCEQVRLDLEYIETQSLWLDVKILLLTIPAVLLGRGAY